MIRGVLLAAVAGVVFMPSRLPAQSGDLWKEGAWSVPAPAAGSCGSLPLLQTKGPGSIFDPAHAAALAALEKALPAALAGRCPGTREIILVSGRTRRLVKVAAAPAASPSAPPSPEAAPTPGAPTPVAPTPVAPAPAASAPVPRREVLPPPQAGVPQASQPTAPDRRSASASPAPSAVPLAASGAAAILSTRSELQSLSSARKNEDKCEVLLAWLESGKTESAQPANYRYRPSTNMLSIFRDEPMTAVFGMAYDKTENRWRLELHEKVISRCLGMNVQRRSPFGGGGPNRTMQQYSQQFAQYQQILNQSFLGQPGPFEPAAITRHVQQVRSQIAWGNQAMAAAASAQPVRETFDQLSVQRQSAARQMALLTNLERQQVADYIGQRQAQLAPTIAENWFRDAANAQRTTAAAKVLHASHAGIAPIVRTLDAPARSAWEDRYNRHIESLIADSLRAEVAKLQGLPATLAGVQQLAGWKINFDAAFRDLRSIPAVQTAEQEYTQKRTTSYASALPVWTEQVKALSLEASEIAVKRRELETLFPAREDRASPIFVQYESPIRAKEDQLRIQIVDERRRQQEAAAAAAAAAAAKTATAAQQPKGIQPLNPRDVQQSTAAVTAASFTARGLNNEKLLTNLFTGEFVNIDIERDELGFGTLFEQYLRNYGRQCDKHLPPNKVEIMYQECATESVTRNGFGVEISRHCVRWVDVGTGIYADPTLYAAKRSLERLIAGDTLRHAGRMLTQMSGNNPLGGMMSMVSNAQAVAADMESLVRTNGCASPGLMRFQENLRLFSLNKQPIRLGGETSVSAVTVVIPGLAYRDQNYAKLAEDLVADHSRTWVMNRYQRGSVGGVSVSARDPEGRPAKIVASYTYNGFSGISQGSVTITLTEGLPECMYFHDFPATCRTPNRKIVAAYAGGSYEQ